MKKLKKIILITLVCASLVAIALQLISNKKEVTNRTKNSTKTEIKVPVKTYVMDSVLVDKSMSLTGEFEAWDEVTVIAETQGSIQAISVEEGQTIKKGKTLARIDDELLETQLKNAQSNYNRAKKDYTRYYNLKQAGGVSQRQLEEAQIAVDNAMSSLTSIKDQIRHTSVSSTISGIVNDVFVEEGSFVMPGNKIASIIQIDKLKIIIKVTEKDLSQIKEGQKVGVSTDVFPTEKFTGKVETISYKADPSRKFKVTISLPNTPENKLRAGMFGRVHLNENQKKNTKSLVIPREAIVGSLKNPSVYTTKNGVANKKEITISEISGNVIEVIKGLRKGDTVVTSGQINLQDGTPVNILK